MPPAGRISTNRALPRNPSKDCKDWRVGRRAPDHSANADALGSPIQVSLTKSSQGTSISKFTREPANRNQIDLINPSQLSPAKNHQVGENRILPPSKYGEGFRPIFQGRKPEKPGTAQAKVAENLPTRPSTGEAPTSGFAAPLMLGMVLMAWLPFKGKKPKPKQLKAPEEESSKALVKVETDQTLTPREKEPVLEKIHRVKNRFKDPLIHVTGFSLANFVFWPIHYAVVSGILFGNALSLTNFLFSRFRPRVNRQTPNHFTWSINLGWKPLELNPARSENSVSSLIPMDELQTIGASQGLSLDLTVARALRFAPPEWVQVWLDYRYPHDLEAQFQFVDQGRIPGGAPIMLRYLKEGYFNLPDYFIKATHHDVIDYFGKVKSREVLPVLENWFREILARNKKTKGGVNPKLLPSLARAIARIKEDKPFIEELLRLVYFFEKKGGEEIQNPAVKKVLKSPDMLWVLAEVMEESGHYSQNQIQKKLETYQKSLGHWKDSDPQFFLLLAKTGTGGILNIPNSSKTKEVFWFKFLENLRRFKRQQKLISDSETAKKWPKFYLNEGIQMAKIYGQAVDGNRYEALKYLRHMAEHPKLTEEQLMQIGEAFYELGEGALAKEIAEKLIKNPQMELIAAQLMDRLEPGWDDSIPKLGPQQLGPYR